MEVKVKLYDAVRMAAWAHDKVLRDLIVEQAVKKYKETGEKLETVCFEDNERYRAARKIFEETMQAQ